MGRAGQRGKTNESAASSKKQFVRQAWFYLNVGSVALSSGRLFIQMIHRIAAIPARVLTQKIRARFVSDSATQAEQQLDTKVFAEAWRSVPFSDIFAFPAIVLSCPLYARKTLAPS